MPALPFKLNQDRRHHIPEQKRKVTNWREYDESLRRRGSLTVWYSDEAVEAWEAERRTSRGGQPEYSDRVFRPGDPDGADVQGRVPAGVPADRRADRLRHRPTRARPRRAGPHYPVPPGRDAGGAAAEAARRRCGERRWPRYRPHAPAGRQHGAEALRRGRVAGGGGRAQEGPGLAGGFMGGLRWSIKTR